MPFVWSEFNGRVKWKVVPLPFSDLSHIFPPISSTYALHIDNPKTCPFMKLQAWIMNLIEAIKNFIKVLIINSQSCVGDKKLNLTRFDLITKFDTSF